MNKRSLTATFLGSVLSFASLAIVHEYGPGECSREARARTELGAELREEAAATTVDVVPSPARTCWVVRCPSCATLTRTGDIRPCPGCGGESPWVLAMRAIVAPPPQEPRAWQDSDNPPPTEGHR